MFPRPRSVAAARGPGGGALCAAPRPRDAIVPFCTRRAQKGRARLGSLGCQRGLKIELLSAHRNMAFPFSSVWRKNKKKGCKKRTDRGPRPRAAPHYLTPRARPHAGPPAPPAALPARRGAAHRGGGSRTKSPARCGAAGRGAALTYHLQAIPLHLGSPRWTLRAPHRVGSKESVM